MWVPHPCQILARVGEENGENSRFGFVAVMTPEPSSLNVHGIPSARKRRARMGTPRFSVPRRKCQ